MSFTSTFQLLILMAICLLVGCEPEAADSVTYQQEQAEGTDQVTAVEDADADSMVQLYPPVKSTTVEPAQSTQGNEERRSVAENRSAEIRSVETPDSDRGTQSSNRTRSNTNSARPNSGSRSKSISKSNSTDPGSEMVHVKAITKTLTGKCVVISDGDTMTILDGRKQIEIRLESVDCPEFDQPFGKKAKQALSKLAFGKKVSVKATGEDRYGRMLGFVFVDGVDVSKQMVATGMAWHYRRYSESEELSKLEEKAIDDKLGLWSTSTNPTPPWEWRMKKREMLEGM